ncbi:MAG: DUF6507 family protein [Actinomycetota bacterium]
MTAWDIDVPQVFAVVTRAGGIAGGFEGDVQSIESAVVELAEGLTKSVLVQGALGNFVGEVLTPGVGNVVGHVDSGFRGTIAAVSAYEVGQLEMAQVAQQNAGLAVYPADAPGGVNTVNGVSSVNNNGGGR